MKLDSETQRWIGQSSRAGIERKGGSLTIKQLRILPPFAIGRLGSASEPMDNYTFDLDIDPSRNRWPIASSRPQPTLIVDENSGEIESGAHPDKLQFKIGPATSVRWRRSWKSLRSPKPMNWCR